MFESRVAAAAAADGAAAVTGWAEVENAACARRVAAIADLIALRIADVEPGQREQWRLDHWAALSAEVGAALGVPPGVASHQMTVALALYDRLPRVAEVFAAGAVPYAVVNAVVFRTAPVKDAQALAKVDADVATHIRDWARWPTARVEQAIDYWIDRYDPYALRRNEIGGRSRSVSVDVPDGSGFGAVWGTLYAHEAEALDKRLDAMARSVCDGDPRDVDQRRADALGALADGAISLACECGAARCAHALPVPATVVVHVVAEQAALSTDDGAPRPPERTARRRPTRGEAFWQPSCTGPAAARPGVTLGGAVLPAPLLPAMARTATVRRLARHGEAPPEAQRVPSRSLADFVRCRDLTCRFPGCDESADRCEVEHTVPWPAGPTQATNLKCVCFTHRLTKTREGWRDEQLPDGTVVWTAPGTAGAPGPVYRTRPGATFFFPGFGLPATPATPATPREGGQPSSL